MGNLEERKDMLGFPIDVGDTIEFVNNEEFRDYGCDFYFLGKQWKIKAFSLDNSRLFVVDGHTPGSSYEYYFPLGCVRLCCDFEDIRVSDVYDLSSLFGE